MPSLDVVSKTNIAEVDNALNGVAREVKQRFDLKDRMCSIERSGNTLTITADNDMLLRQMHDLLYTYCARRGVDNRFLDFKSPRNATKGSLRQEVLIREGQRVQNGGARVHLDHAFLRVRGLCVS